MAIRSRKGLHRITARVGRYGSDNGAGPNGTTEWATESVRRKPTAAPVTLRYQEVEMDVYAQAKLEIDGIGVFVYEAAEEHLNLFDATLALVPTPHLTTLVRRKPAGFRCVGRAGIGNARSYTGGLNAANDDSATPSFDEREAILITYGALWLNRENSVCPTILHEIGHAICSDHGLNYDHFSTQRRAEMGALGRSDAGPSRNKGSLEPLMNAYMNLLLAGSDSLHVQVQGVGSRLDDDRVTRDGLRASNAFSRLPEDWRARFEESRMPRQQTRRRR